MQWDYIVIGAGSAGCALVHELVTSGRTATVLVLEAGGRDRSPFIKLPAAQLYALANHDWGYRSQPDVSRNGAWEHWSRGKVLGGSSSINGTMYVRGAAHDYDRWANSCGAEGATAGWSGGEVMSLFRELECSDQSGPLRGRAGPQHVRTVRRPHDASTAFIEAAHACGYRFNADYNAETQEGVAYAQLSQRKGLRCSAADAFLKPVLGRRNVKLVVNASVRRIEVRNGRAVAVSFTHAGRQRRESGNHIIVSAGALNSPTLLQHSGIGDPRELQRLGIDVAVDLPGVGRNLREHPLLKFVFRTRVPTYNVTGVVQKLGIAARVVANRESPVSNLFEGTAFLRSSASQRVPDIQLHFLPFGYLTLADGTIKPAPYPSVTILLNKSYPLSSGRIGLQSSDPDAPPRIECRLLQEEADLATMVEGVKVVRSIAAAEPLAGLIDEETVPGPNVADGSALNDWVRTKTSIAFHPSGTCRMGTDPRAVVGPDLRVRGVDNLWVADASIMPDLISGNTNAACLMIGKKLGRHLATRR